MVGLNERDQALENALMPFVQAAYECLMFSQDPSDMQEHHMANKSLSDRIREKLSEQFYEDIYIDRPEMERLPQFLEHRTLVLVLGERGSGKTTALRKIDWDFEDTSSTSAHYVDLRQHPNFLQDSSNPYNSAAALLFRELRGKFLYGPKNVDRLVRWNAHLVQTNPVYNALSMAIARTGPTSEKDWIEALSSERFMTWQDAIDKRGDLQAHELFIPLLWFLHNRDSHHITLLIDNVDRYNHRTQRAIVQLALDCIAAIPRGVTPVVAVRSSNYKRLVGDDSTDMPFLAMRLRLEAAPKVEVSNKEDFLDDFVRRRLEFLATWPAIDFFDNASLVLLGEKLGYTPTKFIEAHVRAFAWLRREVAEKAIVWNFLQWHSGSLRSASVHIFNMLYAFVTRADPLFAYREVLEEAASDQASNDPSGLIARSIRTLAYRQLILDRARPPEEPSVESIISDQESAVSTGSLYYPSLKIIEYLNARAGRQSSYGAMVNDFEAIGLSQERLFKSLHQLSMRRGPDFSGVIHIEADDDEPSLNMPSDTKVELLQAGIYLLQRLSTSCEYLFWSAAYAHLGKQEYQAIFGPEDDIPAEKVLSDVYRVNIAIGFLRVSILPRLREELHWHNEELDHDSKGLRARYAEMFGSRQLGGFLPERATFSLRQFVDAQAFPQDEVKQIHEKLDKIRDDCRDLFTV